MAVYQPYYYPYFSARPDLPRSYLQLHEKLQHIQQQQKYRELLQTQAYLRNTHHLIRTPPPQPLQNLLIQQSLQQELHDKAVLNSMQHLSNFKRAQQIDRESAYLCNINRMRRQRQLLDTINRPHPSYSANYQADQKYLTDDQLIRIYQSGVKKQQIEKELAHRRLSGANGEGNNGITGNGSGRGTVGSGNGNGGAASGNGRQSDRDHTKKGKDNNKGMKNNNRNDKDQQNLKKQENNVGRRQANEKRSYIENLRESKGFGHESKGFGLEANGFNGQNDQFGRYSKGFDQSSPKKDQKGKTIDFVRKLSSPFKSKANTKKRAYSKQPIKIINKTLNKTLKNQHKQKSQSLSRTMVYPSNITSQAMHKINNRLKVSQIVYKDSKIRTAHHEVCHLFNTYENEVKGRRQIRNKINNHPDVLKKHLLVAESR